MTKNSQKSLVVRLEEIKRISPTIDVDRVKEYKKAFDEFSERNSLVERVIKGETTFLAEAERAIQVLGGNPYLPDYVDKNDIANFQELVDAIGHPHPIVINNYINLLGNPVVGGIGFGSLIYYLVRIDGQSKENMSRRNFLLIPLLGAAVGAGVGSFGSQLRSEVKHSARENAVYADSIVQELYKK